YLLSPASLYSITPLPPRPTLFPYTTLFRSIVPCGLSDRGVATMTQLAGREITVGEMTPLVIRHFEDVFDLELVRRPTRTEPARVDRKSTRLNSSHQIISYAVFCLKKKNKPT